MASNCFSSLKALYVFQHLYSHEIIRSLHVYCLDGEIQEVERAYLLSTDGDFKEVKDDFVETLKGSDSSEMVVGRIFVAWLCIYAFDVDHPTPWLIIPPLFMSLAKLHSVPTLEKDLQLTFDLHLSMKTRKTREQPRLILNGAEGTKAKPLLSSESPHIRDPHDQKLGQSPYEQNDQIIQLSHSEHVHESVHGPWTQCIYQSAKDACDKQEAFAAELTTHASDSPPDSSKASEHEQSNGHSDGGKRNRRKRASKAYIDSLTLDDIMKCSHLNCEAAAATLNIGTTAFQKKRSELGIKKWPYRSIRSLDHLSRNIQDEAAAEGLPRSWLGDMSTEELHERLEREKEKIKNCPSLEIEHEITRFKRLIWKRRRTRECNRWCKANEAAANTDSEKLHPGIWGTEESWLSLKPSSF